MNVFKASTGTLNRPLTKFEDIEVPSPDGTFTPVEQGVLVDEELFVDVLGSSAGLVM